jgi:hypothetical protein
LNKNLAAEVILLDEDKNEVGKTNTDAITGAYSMGVSIQEDRPYYLVFYHPDFYPAASYVSTRTLTGNDSIFNLSQTLLPLHVGETYIVGIYKPRSQSLGDMLYEDSQYVYAFNYLMEKHPKMKVEVGSSSTTAEEKDWSLGKTKESLSKWRTGNLLRSLITNNTADPRIKVTDFGTKHLSALKEKENKGEAMVKIVTIDGKPTK